MRSFAGVTLFLAAVLIISRSEVKGENDKVQVVTKLGEIEGVKLKSRLGEDFYAFRGVRYAKAPTGDLRFKPPIAVEPWTGVYDATSDGPQCPQPKINEEIKESEDCLTLNIYTKHNATKRSSGGLKPVLFFMHPGGFYAFSGISAFFGPEYLMDRDVVLVSINYRLGSLGFLSTGTVDSPGNMGYKDQVMALKFVRDHIAKFGGNPNSVTAMGYSAGALSITLHMVSPMSQGLFHRAIVMSAAATSHVQHPPHQLDLAEKQARLFNCSTVSPRKIVECLRTADGLEMGQRLSEMFELSGGHPVLIWKAVIEPDFGQERFLIEDPVVSYLEGRYMKIPVISGITQDEFVKFSYDILTNDTMKYEFDQKFNELAPICFLYERNTPRSREISQTLRKKYVNFPLITESRIPELGELFSDSTIGFSVHRFVQLASRHTKVFYYKHTFRGRYSFFEHPKGTPYGVVHHDDLLYLFGIPLVAPKLFTLSDPENLNVERMTRMWTTFAAKGNPNDSEDEYLKKMQWTPYTSTVDNYLEIGNGENFTMREGLFAERFRIWDELFPLPLTNKSQHL
ncbi:Carboxylic ester hydrolase [Sergentomyia squamirostris]